MQWTCRVYINIPGLCYDLVGYITITNLCYKHVGFCTIPSLWYELVGVFPVRNELCFFAVPLSDIHVRKSPRKEVVDLLTDVQDMVNTEIAWEFGQILLKYTCTRWYWNIPTKCRHVLTITHASYQIWKDKSIMIMCVLILMNLWDVNNYCLLFAADYITTSQGREWQILEQISLKEMKDTWIMKKKFPVYIFWVKCRCILEELERLRLLH